MECCGLRYKVSLVMCICFGNAESDVSTFSMKLGKLARFAGFWLLHKDGVSLYVEFSRPPSFTPAFLNNNYPATVVQTDLDELV